MKKIFKTVLETNGAGLWSEEAKKVRVTGMEIDHFHMDNDDGHGELRVYFGRSWDTDLDGLIYTDPLWIKQLREFFRSLGFSEKATRDVGYSEQGMQGDDYVSLDIGHKFAAEFLSRV